MESESFTNVEMQLKRLQLIKDKHSLQNIEKVQSKLHFEYYRTNKLPLHINFFPNYSSFNEIPNNNKNFSPHSSMTNYYT